MNVNNLLDERQATHGDFVDHAYYTQALKNVMHEAPGWLRLSHAQKESLEMIQHKIGRILAGDPNYEDHIADIAGYAELYRQSLPRRSSADQPYGKSFREEFMARIHEEKVCE